VKLRRIVIASVGVGLSVLLAVLADSETAYARQAHPAGWLEDHGAEVGDDASSCAACHAQNNCRTCHVAPVPDAISELPEGDGLMAIARRAPDTHVVTFAENHKVAAAANTAQCQTCHTPEGCSSCHTTSAATPPLGRRTGGYHVGNFQIQHSAAAFGRESECATCHNPEAFCRDCHVSRGLGSEGRSDRGFHNETPTWIFGHGQAARQGLESCATCHAQSDCLSCHSALTGRSISPHGPGFDAEQLRSKNEGMCLSCHVSVPR
jgi:hypothetical protein